MASSEDPTTSSQASSLSFTQGFLLGQLTVVILIFSFIKFFIFGDPPNGDARAATRAALRRQRTLQHHRRTRTRTRSFSTSASASSQQQLRRKRSSVLRPAPPLTTAAILAKTYYNVHGHQPESLDWFNVLVAQTIAQLRADAQADEAILASLTEVLNGPGKPEWVDEIKITEISLGEEFPIFSNCRVIPVEEAGAGPEGRLQARMDVDLSDVITLGVETRLMLNYPRPLVAVLPVALSVSVVRFSGTLSLSFIPSSSNPSSNPSFLDNSTPDAATSPQSTTLAFTFLDDYRLDLSVRSLVGSRSRLQDVPKIAQLVEARLHDWFDERCVEPRVQQIVLPSLWPRKKNTRVDGDDGAASDGSVDGDTKSGRERGTAPGFSERRSTERHPQARESPSRDAQDFERRMAAEGRKIREAEQRENHGGTNTEALRRRFRGYDRESAESSRQEGFYRIPGAMPDSNIPP